ncbi:hypothetical protein RF11_14532 [Thelohanellus kitauei]|uniref:Integrase catalytic domain-containing protein n=1 Tax=Thelohanellus kitauei TaxID=669202 RepID=A0A0C2J7Z0_THEKT|nr:hypothetical protein RF11_14532 [Thelohanellus kitauei]
MDITGPFPLSKAGNRYILVIQDYFSKLVVTIPLENITANTITKAFLDQFAFKFGMPISVHIDMGMQFQSSLFKEVLNKLERFNRTLINSLSKCSNMEEEWDLYLQSVIFSYNISINETTGASNTAQICQAKQYNKRNSNIQCKTGNYVYLFVPIDGSKCTNKLSKLWRGPYQIFGLKPPLILIERDFTIQWAQANRTKKDESEIHENIDEKPPLCSSDSEDESIGDGNSVYPSEPGRYNLRPRENIKKNQ